MSFHLGERLPGSLGLRSVRIQESILRQFALNARDRYCSTRYHLALSSQHCRHLNAEVPRDMPNSSPRRKNDATLALWRIFLLGRQAMLGHDPPMYLRSITATRCPLLAKVHAARVDPVPSPRITRS